MLVLHGVSPCSVWSTEVLMALAIITTSGWRMLASTIPRHHES